MIEKESSVSASISPHVSSKRLVRAIWITGLVLPSLTGLIALSMLQSRGIPTVSLGRGFGLVIPFTFFIELPFAILAWIVHLILSRVLKRIPPEERNMPADVRRRWVGWSIVSAGALLGLTIAMVIFMLGVYQSPQGFAAALSMTMALLPITLPILLAWSIGAVVAGGILGALFALFLSFFFPNWLNGKRLSR